jgi:uncharacterized protein
MIKVHIKKEVHFIQEIKLSGHALFAEMGQDIVCASATTAAIVTANGIERLYGQDAITSKASSGVIHLIIKKSNDVIELLLDNLINSLKDLENQYPDNIKII